MGSLSLSRALVASAVFSDSLCVTDMGKGASSDGRSEIGFRFEPLRAIIPDLTLFIIASGVFCCGGHKYVVASP